MAEVEVIKGRTEEDSAMIAQARDKWASDDIEIDATAKISCGENGFWVQAWVWVWAGNDDEEEEA